MPWYDTSGHLLAAPPLLYKRCALSQQAYIAIPNLPVIREDGYTIGNVFLHTPPQTAWQASAFVENVTGEELVQILTYRLMPYLV